MKKVGRPSSGKYPVLAVRHRDDGDVLAWSDGHISGRPERVALAHSFLSAGRVTLGHSVYAVDNETPDGVLPALVAAMGERAVVTRGAEGLAEEGVAVSITEEAVALAILRGEDPLDLPGVR